MAISYDWPAEGERHLIGTRINRLDGPDKASGRAKYAYDRNITGMLVARLVTSPHAHARITAIDTSAAEKMPGFRAVEIMNGSGAELQWEGQEIAAVAADTEEQARDAARAVKVTYEVLPHVVKEQDLTKVGDRVSPAADKTKGDPESAFSAPGAVVHEGFYGLPVITHCCLESHGQVIEWDGDNIIVYASTQAVGRIGADLAKNLSADDRFGSVSPANVRVITPVMGGGFGSKFAIDSWGVACAKLAKSTGKPVKLMLDRKEELLIAGTRPSDFGNIKVAATKDGKITAYQSETWSTGGMGSRGAPPLPYVVEPEHSLVRHTSVETNTGPARAWRAPNHPQAAMLTHTAFTDLAAKLKMDPLDLYLKNLDLTARPDVYREELLKGAELIDWRVKFHQPGAKADGHMRRGLGLSMHTWGGRPHDSDCRVSIYSDGSAVAELGSQDLGTGTRTVIGIVLADTMGLPLEAVTVKIGDSNYPPSGASGGSTTVGGVSASTRRAAVHAARKLTEVVAPFLETTADQLELKHGRVRMISDHSRSLSWKQACGKLGAKTISELGRQPDRNGGKLNDQGVGGVQMADVLVDVETGIVKIEQLVAVQDCGYLIDLKTAESQVYGALIMGVAWALYEERIFDQQTGTALNADMEFYKLGGIGDIGNLVVHMMSGPGYDERGVIGLGEPPAISPGTAISNAVFNALGVRVPTLPLTPDKVLAALEKGGMA